MEITDILWKFLQSFLELLIPLLVPLLLAWITPLAIKAWMKLKGDAGDKFILVEQIVALAVKAAEQAQVAGIIEDKKAYAIDVATLWLKSKNIKLDIALLDAAIEAAVHEYFNSQVVITEEISE